MMHNADSQVKISVVSSVYKNKIKFLNTKRGEKHIFVLLRWPVSNSI